MTASRIVASVGTDHHPFPRLMEWLEAWLALHPDTSLTVQHGATRPCEGALNLDMVTPGELVSRFAAADAVVLQGGPGGIMDARNAGRIPIVIPRLAELGEVVDDHQVDFSRRLAQQGLIVLAESADDLHRVLMSPPAPIAPGADGAPGVAAGVALLAHLPDPLARADRRRRRRWSARQLVGVFSGR